MPRNCKANRPVPFGSGSNARANTQPPGRPGVACAVTNAANVSKVIRAGSGHASRLRSLPPFSANRCRGWRQRRAQPTKDVSFWQHAPGIEAPEPGPAGIAVELAYDSGV
jgi:hypothetical protein